MSNTKSKSRKINRRTRFIVRLLSAIITIVFLVIVASYLFNLFLGEGKLTDFFQEFTSTNRALSYVIYLVMMPLINIIPGISSLFGITLANMLFNYGTVADMWITFALCASSVIMTSTLMFLIGRWGGKRIVRWIVEDEEIEKVNKYLTVGGKAVIPMMYALPLFPDDTICMIAGMTDISFIYNFGCSVFFRNISVFVMCFLGTDFLDYHSFTWWQWLAFISAAVVVFLICLLISRLYYRHLMYKEEGRRFLLVTSTHAKESISFKKCFFFDYKKIMKVTKNPERVKKSYSDIELYVLKRKKDILATYMFDTSSYELFDESSLSLLEREVSWETEKRKLKEEENIRK